MLDISPLNRSEPDFSIPSRGRFRGAPLEIFKSIHSLEYSSFWTENWWGDTRHQSARSCGIGFFWFPPSSYCGSAPLAIYKTIDRPLFLSDWAETWQDDTRYQSARNLIFLFPQSALLGRAYWNFQSIYSLQYWLDWAETWYDNTRHQSAQSLWAGFF